MGGKHPKTIITDQDLAMRAAIKKIFPHTRHHNCYFHIAKKAKERGGRTFAMEQNKNLHADLFDILRNSVIKEKFKQLYFELPRKYDVRFFKYMEEMWNIRAQFVLVYFKNDFYPFVHSTTRSEGTNGLFKLDVGSTYSVMRFMQEF
uniref:Protein FAR1-RELATED SEQUENCE n=1 Tax=Arundo donax TaxID=35708 RepID=A0A0A9DJU5_ARUDO